MFWLRVFLTTLLFPIVMTVFFLVKDKILAENKALHDFNLGKLVQAGMITFLVLFGLFFTLGIFKIFQFDKNIKMNLVRIIVFSILAIFFYLMIYRNSINKYRSVMFIALAISLSIGFMADMFETQGHFLIYTYEDIITHAIPFCYMVIPQTIVPALTKNTIVFPGTPIQVNVFYHTISFMILLWISLSLALGRGWCSWICFWGGWEEGFSKVLKKPVIKKCNPKLRMLPFAIFFVSIIMTILFVGPFYCFWLCPFKGVTECGEIISPPTVMQTIVFLGIFVSLVIVLSILTKKRTQCAFFCPFGALQSIVDKINIFKYRIDKQKCTDCKKCLKECPVMSITETSLEKGSVGFTCIKCGKCSDICPKKAINIGIKGTPISGKTGNFFGLSAKIIYFIITFFIFGTVGGGMILGGLYRVVLFITTGSFIE